MVSLPCWEFCFHTRICFVNLEKIVVFFFLDQWNILVSFIFICLLLLLLAWILLSSWLVLVVADFTLNTLSNIVWFIRKSQTEGKLIKAIPDKLNFSMVLSYSLIPVSYQTHCWVNFWAEIYSVSGQGSMSNEVMHSSVMDFCMHRWWNAGRAS